MNSKGFAGCCQAHEIYNLGGAHGVATAYNQKEFDDKMRPYAFHDRYGSVFVAIINSGQWKTKEYMEAQGWKFQKVAHLDVGTIDKIDLRKYLRAVEYPKEQEAPKPRFALTAPQEVRQPEPLIPAPVGQRDGDVMGITLTNLGRILNQSNHYPENNIFGQGRQELVRNSYMGNQVDLAILQSIIRREYNVHVYISELNQWYWDQLVRQINERRRTND